MNSEEKRDTTIKYNLETVEKNKPEVEKNISLLVEKGYERFEEEGAGPTLTKSILLEGIKNTIRNEKRKEIYHAFLDSESGAKEATDNVIFLIVRGMINDLLKSGKIAESDAVEMFPDIKLIFSDFLGEEKYKELDSGLKSIVRSFIRRK